MPGHRETKKGQNTNVAYSSASPAYGFMKEHIIRKNKGSKAITCKNMGLK
jgi:hypothetical protein